MQNENFTKLNLLLKLLDQCRWHDDDVGVCAVYNERFKGTLIAIGIKFPIQIFHHPIFNVLFADIIIPTSSLRPPQC